ncbi:hypothetical protein LptCag_0303 [Leptospirillum ferriphilum]|uniref:Uncharacterized protein n=1 Tax=Leptospirillum ferriphilum TaxID=178606 RepID=A0A094WC61_9BACT|nr:hypothetical protein LptCag_0303 [Leptospirillum ferriphilum]
MSFLFFYQSFSVFLQKGTVSFFTEGSFRIKRECQDGWDFLVEKYSPLYQKI